VAAVVLYHANVPFVTGGYIGVDVFFVVSGYLITGHLMKERAETGRISLIRFYGRRLRRLAPMALLVASVTLVASKVWLAPLLLPMISRDGIASSLALSNIWFAFTGTDYLAQESPSPFQHYWSLAVEEQFYLIWPLLLILLSLAFRDRRSMGVAIAGLSVASFIGCIWLTSVSQPWAFFGLPTRAWELGVGALIALWPRPSWSIRPWTARLFGWGGLALIANAVLTFDSTTPFPGWTTALPVIGSAAILLGGASRQSYSVASLLETRPLRYLGDISYSLYLWHWPLFVIPALVVGADLSPIVMAALVVLSIVLARLSYVHVEQRFQQTGHSAARKSTYSLAIGFTGLTVCLSLWVGLLPSLSSSASSPEPSELELMETPTVPDFVPSNLEPTLNAVDSNVPIVYNDGCHADVPTTISPDCVYGNTSSDETIVLFGDSHAAQWFSPLRTYAEERGMAMVSLTKSACPSVDMRIENLSLRREYTECTTWRNNAMARIDQLRPELVVMANATAGYPNLTLTKQGFGGQWEDGLQSTLGGFPVSSKVVVLGDTPRWGISPNVCLSAHLETAQACSGSRADLVNSTLDGMKADVAQRAGGRFIATDDWLCNTRCSPVLWNKLVYRDSNHITDAMARALTSRLSEELDKM
jgi:peptidoglycan/LPS O-acetylase OafA/YrhL